MERVAKSDLLSLLICVECGADAMAADGDALSCTSCGRAFHACGGKPVLMRNDNSLFPPGAYADAAGGRPPRRHGLKAQLKRAIPGKSVNIARDRVLERIANAHLRDGAVVLVLGCGNQEGQMLEAFADNRGTVVFCDVDKASGADVLCDAHRLPFADGAFDCVISTAVMEHVLVPDRVVDEVYRVLSANGIVYSEVPFLQAVHEGAYDFTRFSLSGHRRLYDRFDEEASGVVAGPGTALVWSLVSFFRALSPSPRGAQFLGMLAQTLFFWLKYADYMIAKNNRAADAASCTFFLGKRRETPICPNAIIERYGNTGFSHT